MAIIGPMAQNGQGRLGRWNWLLLVPVALVLFPALYTRMEPAFFGFPFFYLYQFGVVVLTALLTAVVYWRTRH